MKRNHIRVQGVAYRVQAGMVLREDGTLPRQAETARVWSAFHRRAGQRMRSVAFRSMGLVHVKGHRGETFWE